MGKRGRLSPQLTNVQGKEKKQKKAPLSKRSASVSSQSDKHTLADTKEATMSTNKPTSQSIIKPPTFNPQPQKTVSPQPQADSSGSKFSASKTKVVSQNTDMNAQAGKGENLPRDDKQNNTPASKM